MKASSLFVFSDSAYVTCSKLLTALYFQAIQNILGHRDIPIDFLPFSLNMLRVASLLLEVQVVWALNEALELRNGSSRSRVGHLDLEVEHSNRTISAKKSWWWSDGLIGWPSAFWVFSYVFLSRPTWTTS